MNIYIHNMTIKKEPLLANEYFCSTNVLPIDETKSSQNIVPIYRVNQHKAFLYFAKIKK